MKVKHLLAESTESVGREYQHIEDIVYIRGPEGALQALNRIRAIDKNSSDLEVKWDGSPAIYFGRDERGNFHFGDKYHRTLNQSPEQLEQTYTKGQSLESQSPERQQFINNMKTLWELYRSATPTSFRGYIEAGLLYSKLSPPGDKLSPTLEDEEWIFQPNTVIYHVDANSPLGKRITQSTTGAAATGYFDLPPGMGGQRMAVGNNANSLGNAQVLIIPRKTSTEQVMLDDSKIRKVERFIRAAAPRIDQFINPSNAWIESYPTPVAAVSAWRRLIYTYVNSQVDVSGGLESLGNNILEWITNRAPISVLTKGRKALAINHIQKNISGMRATFLVVRAFMHLKDTVINQVEQKTLASIGIRAELPLDGARVPGGEGFVDDPEGGSNPLKFVKRGAFTAANRSKDRSIQSVKPNLSSKAMQALKENKHGKTAVVGWGRGMGHKGHMYLANSVFTTAQRLNAKPFFIVSETFGKNDPLPPEEKLKIYRTVFPEHAADFHTARQPIPALQKIYDSGYDNLIFIVGGDQKNAFEFLAKPTKSTGELPVPFKSIKVISRQETGDPYAKEDGPRATPMRDILKSTASPKEKFALWRDSMPRALDDREVLRLMQLADKNIKHFSAKKVQEADNPNYFGAGYGTSPIPGTPESLQPRPSPRKLRHERREEDELLKWMGHWAKN